MCNSDPVSLLGNECYFVILDIVLALFNCCVIFHGKLMAAPVCSDHGKLLLQGALWLWELS